MVVVVVVGGRERGGYHRKPRLAVKNPKQKEKDSPPAKPHLRCKKQPTKSEGFCVNVLLFWGEEAAPPPPSCGYACVVCVCVLESSSCAQSAWH